MDEVADRVAERMMRSPARLSVGEVYDRYAPQCVRLAFLLTGDAETARDITNEAFVRVCGRWTHIRSEGALPSYLRTTVINLTRNHMRRAGLERRTTMRAGFGTPRPRDVAEELVSRADMWATLQALPYRQRAAIVLRYYEDLSEAETAQSLGCSIDSVKGLVARGLKSLRRHLEV